MTRWTNIDELDEMERWVNDGSPSGFGVSSQLSPATDPFGAARSFRPLLVRASSGLEMVVYRSEKLPLTDLPTEFCIHPDMRQKWLAMNCEVAESEKLELVPTSSGRTARMVSSAELDYLKFDYDKTLGRVNRSITPVKAIASVEINDELVSALEKRKSGSIGIFPEHAVVLARPAGAAAEFSGVLFRSGAVIGGVKPSGSKLAPMFSFWSSDSRDGSDDYVLKGLFGGNRVAMGTAAVAACFDVLDFYFFMLIERGLQLEFNAQNVLVALDDKGEYAGCCLRDFNSTEKDLPIRRANGLSIEFRSAPYKVLALQDAHYLVRHSFAFDFKLTEYVVQPLLKLAAKCGVGPLSRLRDEARQCCAQWIARSPVELFPPDRKWYTHPKMLLTEKRPYEERTDPWLR